jgi:hypothetical protein
MVFRHPKKARIYTLVFTPVFTLVYTLVFTLVYTLLYPLLYSLLFWAVFWVVFWVVLSQMPMLIAGKHPRQPWTNGAADIMMSPGRSL